MRALIATLGSRGDVQPMVALALGLKARGHAVRFCGPTDFGAMVTALGLEFVDLGVDVQRFLEAHPDLNSGRLRAFGAAKEVFARLLETQFQVLEDAAHDVDVILGAGVISAPASIAEVRGIPYRFVAFGSMAIPSRHSPSYMFPRPGLPPFVNLALWRLTDHLLGSFAGAAINQHRERLGLPRVHRLSHHLTKPGSLILAADPELSPPPFDYDPAIAVTGALCMSHAADATLPPDVEAFLQNGPPPVYIGFGSMTDHDPATTTELVVTAVRETGLRAILGSGWAGLGGVLPPEVMACGEVQHELLMPRLAGVVHHGGAGTTATAARGGVPQLVVPHLLDQFYWGRQVAALGIGPPPLRRRALTAGRLAERLRTLTRDIPMREKAAALATPLRARHGVAAAVTALESQVPV
jgi:UDP:flavonoid glycosyltransferase YjiC (YdhE family)